MIGWNRGGVAEILSHVYPQGLVEAENEKALLETVKHHIEQPQTVAPVTMFSLKDMCDQTLELYQSVLNNPIKTRDVRGFFRLKTSLLLKRCFISSSFFVVVLFFPFTDYKYSKRVTYNVQRSTSHIHDTVNTSNKC